MMYGFLRSHSWQIVVTNQQLNPSRYDQIAGALHGLMSSYGYERLETPILQPAEMFLTRAGDQIITRLFTFERGGKQMALRPEYTSPALSLYCEQNCPVPARWQFGGLVFEESPAAPQVQHYSIGAEVFGLPNAFADGEILQLALKGLAQAGIDDAAAHIGHVALLRYFVRRHMTDARLQRFLLNRAHLLRTPEGEAHVRQQMDRLVPATAAGKLPSGGGGPSPAIMDALLQSLEQSQLMGGRTRDDIQRRLQRKLTRSEVRPQIEATLVLLRQIVTIEGTSEIVLPQLKELIGGDPDGLALLDEWTAVLDAATSMGVDPARLVLSPGLSRNWDYYSGIVFELRGGGKHLGGGGRYDELARLLGSPEPVAAVGFAYYVDEILGLLPAEAPARGPITLSWAASTPALRAWLDELRGAGLPVALVAAGGELTVGSGGHLHCDGVSFTPLQAAEAIAFLEARL